ncbi:hypothetical protein [Psychrobacter sanguinis]|uniref:hypothetical protein n=1 Tax=Psychrobacter sanguinis TaxID=861445 RepID=UPI001919A47B|nr:hypothetical protein [Psychrobacter sanguinis]UEC26759.1 hypothetical protein LK453_06660 [Psychrobacter sanguinis]
MKYSKLIKLSAIGLALLLIPRRSSRQSEQSVPTSSDSNLNSDPISNAPPDQEAKQSAQSEQPTQQSYTNIDSSGDK